MFEFLGKCLDFVVMFVIKGIFFLIFVAVIFTLFGCSTISKEQLRHDATQILVGPTYITREQYIKNRATHIVSDTVTDAVESVIEDL